VRLRQRLKKIVADLSLDREKLGGSINARFGAE
jgi:hypothetical protein